MAIQSCGTANRHLIPAVAAAGYHAVAPDMRGYGDTDCPAPLAAYTMNNLVGDVVQLAQALGATRDNPAHIVGHDWGATISQRTSSAWRPDLFSTVTLLGGALLRGAAPNAAYGSHAATR